VIEAHGLRMPDRLYKAYAFDLDGTIYLGDHLLPGAKRLVEELRARNVAVRFLSNNPTKDPEQYAAKLEKLGLPTPVDEIVNTVVTMTRSLLDQAPDAVVFPISEPALDTGLASALVLTGETKAEDLQRLSASDTPQFVLDRVDRLLPPDIWNELGWEEEP
jgi:ribonucleotide monophosphatase NagD (HAD superfamily)